MKKLLSLVAALILVAIGAFAAINSIDFGQPAEPATSADWGEQAQPSTEAAASKNNDAHGGYTFRSKKLFDQHFDKHGAEFGSITQQQYLDGANALITSETALTKTDEDGDAMFYDASKNEFAVLSTDGYIRTYFKPDDGIDYWNRQ